MYHIFNVDRCVLVSVFVFLLVFASMVIISPESAICCEFLFCLFACRARPWQLDQNYKQSGLLITLDQINIHSFSFLLITLEQINIHLYSFSFYQHEIDAVYDNGNDVNDS